MNYDQETNYGVSLFQLASQASSLNPSGDINMNGYVVYNSSPSVTPNGLTTLAQVQQLITLGTQIPISDISNSYLNTGSTNFNSFKIVNLANPTASTDGLNLGYADGRYYLNTTPLNLITLPTASLDLNAQTITNLSTGVGLGDAVNVAQLNSVINTSNHIQSALLEYVLTTYTDRLELLGKQGDTIKINNESLGQMEIVANQSIEIASNSKDGISDGYILMSNSLVKIGCQATNILTIGATPDVTYLVNSFFSSRVGVTMDQTLPVNDPEQQELITRKWAESTFSTSGTVQDKIEDSTSNYVLQTFVNKLELTNNTSAEQILFVNSSPEWNIQTTQELNLYSFLGALLNRSYLKLGSDQITLGTTSFDILKMSSVLNADNINNSFNTPTGYDFDQTTCEDRQFISKHYADLTYNKGVQDAIQTTTSAAYKVNTLGTGVTFGSSGVVTTGEFSNVMQLNDTGTQWLMRSNLPIEINTQSGTGSGIINVNNNNVKLSGDIYSETVGNNAIEQAISGIVFDSTTSDISRNVNKECGQMTINFTGSTNADQTFKVRGSKNYTDPSTYNVTGIVVQQDDFATAGQNYIGLFGMSIGNNELQLMINSARLDTALYDANYINLIQSQSTIPAQLLVMTPTPAASGNSILMYNDSMIATKPLLNYTTTRFGMLNAQISTVDNNEYLTRGLADTLYTGSGSGQSIDQISVSYPTAANWSNNAYKIINVNGGTSSGQAIEYDQVHNNTSIVDVLQDIPLFANNQVACTSANLTIQNNNSNQIRVMGAGTNILWTASDIPDANGMQIRNLVTQGIDSTQNPVTSVTNDYQYATKGYVDSVATGGIQSLIQDNNVTPNIVLQTGASDLVLTNNTTLQTITYTSNPSNNIQSSSSDMIFNAYGSTNDQLLIGNNIQKQTINSIEKQSSNPTGTVFLDVYSNEYQAQYGSYPCEFNSSLYGGSKPVIQIKPINMSSGVNNGNANLRLSTSALGSTGGELYMYNCNNNEGDPVSGLSSIFQGSAPPYYQKVGIDHDQSAYTPQNQEFICKAYADLHYGSASGVVKKAQFNAHYVANVLCPYAFSGTFTTVYNGIPGLTTNAFSQIVLNTGKTYQVSIQGAANNGVTRSLNYQPSGGGERYGFSNQGGASQDAGRIYADYSTTQISQVLYGASPAFPNFATYIVKQTDSTFLRPACFTNAVVNIDIFLSIIVEELD